MDRHLYKKLIEWKKDPERMPLIVRGARQVGKSYLIEKLGKEQFKQIITINFELIPLAKRYFEDLNPAQIINQIELGLGVRIGDDGQTLLFLDEIQECPKAILALRYFKEQKNTVPVIAAGSLLEFTLNAEAFRMPVGRVQYLYLQPLCFEEYIMARGFTQLAVFLQNYTLTMDFPESLHMRLLELMREYMIVGGMPSAVNTFIETGRFQASQNQQQVLLSTYRDDFGKYAKQSQQRYLQTFFEKTPGLVGEKFKFSKIDPELRARELKPALEGLVMAGLIHLVYCTAASGLPLVSTRHDSHFKLLFVDVGLMVKAAQLPAELLLRADFFALNRGAVMEQLVGQELLALTPPEVGAALYCWVREKVSSMAEVDYLLAVDEHIIPIEVKAGSTGRLKSLQVFLQEKSSPLGVKISSASVTFEKNVLSVPVYMVHVLPRLVREQIHAL